MWETFFVVIPSISVPSELYRMFLISVLLALQQTAFVVRRDRWSLPFCSAQSCIKNSLCHIMGLDGWKGIMEKQQMFI